MNPELVAPLRLNGVVVDERTLRAIIVSCSSTWGSAAAAVVILIDPALRGLDLTAFQALADSWSALGNRGRVLFARSYWRA